MDLIIAANSVPVATADVVPATGTPQLATAGNPATSTPATTFPPYHYNLITRSLVQIIDKAGLPRSGSDYTQLFAALEALFGGSGSLTPNGGYWTFPGGLTVQFGVANSGANGYTTIPLPIAFPSQHLVTLTTEQHANGWIPGGSGSAIPSSHGVYNKTLAQFQVFSVNWNSGSNTWVGVSGDAFAWLAIGY